ncbi:MAG: methyltransferase domain-containing protein [Pseudomonadota bacterium]
MHAEAQIHDPTFWDRIADKYFKQPIADESAYRTKLTKTRERLRPDVDVLEIGCGTGGTAIAHAPYVRHVHALDISENMLEIARRQADNQDVRNVTFECADIAGFDAPPESYDVVLAMSLLHLVRDRRTVIEHMLRVLKPGGLFISSTPCIADRMAWFRFVAPLGRAIGKVPYVEIFKASDLVEDLKAAGFEIEHQWRPKDGKALAVFLIARKMAH